MKKIYTTIFTISIMAVLLLSVNQNLQGDNFTEKDIEKWNKAFQEVVQKGEKKFHSALGSNKVSCDMCHPNATNTHPETYPKFQKQLGKVATLREMINWCIINPLEGKPLALDDPVMIMLEAYITHERRGVKLNPGKH